MPDCLFIPHLFVNLHFNHLTYQTKSSEKMKHSVYKNLLIAFSLFLLFQSCKTTTVNPVTISDNATITAIEIQLNTKSPNASSVVFTIDNDKGEIYNIDSLPYNTRVDSLYPLIRFYSSDGFIVNDLTYAAYSNVTKAVDFTKKVKILNIASDGKSKKEYMVDLRVHKVNPYEYRWTKLTDKIGENVYENQRAVLFKGNYMLFTGSGSANYLYTSPNALTWTQETVSGLPAGISFQNIDTFNITQNPANNTLYLVSDNALYTSKNGTDWTKAVDNNYTYKALLGQFQNKLYAIGQDKASAYHIIVSTDGTTWAETYTLSTANDFPITAFGATTFTLKNGLPRMIVVGGKNQKDVKLNTRWTTDGENWVKLENPKSSFSEISGTAIAHYGSSLLLLGGTDKMENLGDSVFQFRTSLTEGLSWDKPTITLLDKNYKYRQGASVIVNPKERAFYIIGGRGKDGAMADVWRVKVNYYAFKDWEENPNKY